MSLVEQLRREEVARLFADWSTPAVISRVDQGLDSDFDEFSESFTHFEISVVMLPVKSSRQPGPGCSMTPSKVICSSARRSCRMTFHSQPAGFSSGPGNGRSSACRDPEMGESCSSEFSRHEVGDASGAPDR